MEYKVSTNIYIPAVRQARGFTAQNGLSQVGWPPVQEDDMSHDDWKTTEPDFYDPNREELDPEEAGIRHLCKICMCGYDCLDALVPEGCCACTCPLQCIDEIEENELLNLMAEDGL